MNHKFTRREFVAAVAAEAAIATTISGGPVSGESDQTDAITEQSDDQQNKFSFLLLGDTHFDRIDHHDLDWMRSTHFEKDISQVENYCRHTREDLPQLLAAARTGLVTANPSPAFALHAGDLVEGICGNESLATRHCREGWQFFQDAQLGVPLLMTKGNHDVTGPGAIEAFNKVLLPATVRELNLPQPERASYSFRRGDNLFAVYDAYDHTSIDWLEDIVRADDFRRLFVLLHLPVVPYNARATWRVFDQPRHAERRQRLLDVLGRYRAIVLSGHLHKYSLLVRRCRTGKFAQLAISSIVRKARTQHLNSIDDYGPQLTELDPNFSPDTLDARRRLLATERPLIEHFEYADTSGFAMLSVTPDDVFARMYSIDKPDPWKSISIEALLGTRSGG